jgi:hypothetical protein
MSRCSAEGYRGVVWVLLLPAGMTNDQSGSPSAAGQFRTGGLLLYPYQMYSTKQNTHENMRHLGSLTSKVVLHLQARGTAHQDGVRVWV